MPILVATQATDSAWALGNSILTVALVKEGLLSQKAQKKKKLTILGLLKYAEEQVPVIYKKIIRIYTKFRGKL